MTKSKMQWEDALDDERASLIAKRFAIEDLALKYRTSLKIAEGMLANGIVVDRQERPPRSTDTIEIQDENDKSFRELPGEYMDVDSEGLGSSEGPARENAIKTRYCEPTTSSSHPQFSAIFPPKTLFSTRTKATNRVTSFSHHSPLSNPRFSSHTWPYFEPSPHLTRSGPFITNQRYPLVYTLANPNRLPYIPFELLQNHCRLATSAAVGKTPESASTSKDRVFVSQEERLQEERSRIYTPPRMFTPPHESPRMFETPEEVPRMFTPPENKPRFSTSVEKKPHLLALQEENVPLFGQSDKSSEGFNRSYSSPENNTSRTMKARRHSDDAITYEKIPNFDTENSRILFEQRRRSQSPDEKNSECPKTVKPRRHSDETNTNSNRPSVIVMRRFLSNPTDCSTHADHYENCTCNNDHHTTDSDSSKTPPLTQDEPSSSVDSNKEDKPHKCQVCGRAFRKHSALVIHHRVHSGEKPYRCPECSKNFSISGNLRRHFLIHTGERPYACPECSRAFNNPSHLTRHRRKLHNAQKSTEN